MNKIIQKKTKIEVLLEALIKENHSCKEGLEIYKKQEKYHDKLKDFNRIRPSIFLKDISKEKEYIANAFAIVDGIGSELLKNYLGIKPFNWFILNHNSKNDEIEIFIKRIESENKFFAIGTGFIQDIGKYIQIEYQKRCICIPTALSTHVYGSMHISNHEIFNLKEKSTSFKSNIPAPTWIDYSFLKDINTKNPKLMKNGISDVYALKTATKEWQDSPKYIGNKIDKATLILSKEAINLLHKCVEFECIESLVLAQALLNVITEIQGSAPASGTEHLYANVMENIFQSQDPHGLLVAKGILFQENLRPNKNIKEVEKEMESLGIFPYKFKNNNNYKLDKNIMNEMIKLAKRKKRFTYLIL